MFEVSHSRFPSLFFFCEWRMWTTPAWMDYACMAETDVGQTVSGPISASASGQILWSRTDVVARCGSGRNCSLRASPSQSCVACVSGGTRLLLLLLFLSTVKCVCRSRNTMSVKCTAFQQLFHSAGARFCVCVSLFSVALFVCQWALMFGKRG